MICFSMRFYLDDAIYIDLLSSNLEQWTVVFFRALEILRIAFFVQGEVAWISLNFSWGQVLFNSFIYFFCWECLSLWNAIHWFDFTFLCSTLDNCQYLTISTYICYHCGAHY